ncbi:peptidase [Streptomyces sp. R302]|uniref:leishmanolysin-related zinc metalloendopeptidase n=1 Tax=unclassified Streptomyces TaxID=2593676 RepID=UPI00145E395A|nr:MULTISPECIES: leishmanolysin-related zinc metalloendopeptidase [unclassified Streptomyces]NML51621.1 peptidase [Streptomyces sp. R301]NML81241.1 peptidase [Streptomyces sp. R302]
MGGRQNHAIFETYTAVADGGRAAEIAATTSPFQIEVRFVQGLTAGQKAVFAEAAERWTRVIVGDLETAIVRDFSGTVVVDDVLIDAEGVPIDGTDQVPNILGQAGPTRFRRPNAVSGARLPVTGRMRFDSADLAEMEADGSLLDVITHEMGHVLGIGTLWDDFGLREDFPGPNPTYVGAAGMEEFGTLVGEPPGPVPVANTGGMGSAGSHWRESVFDNELMSPSIDGNDNPLSRLTVASLQDLGYTVDLDAAEPYALPNLLAVARSGRVLATEPRRLVLPTIPSRVPAEAP